MKTIKQKIILVLFIFFAIFSLTYGIIQFMGSVNTELKDSIDETIHSATFQQQVAINETFEEKLLELQTIVETIQLIGADEDFLIEYLTNIKKVNELDTLILSDLDGYGIMANGEIVNLSQNENFAKAISGELCISEPKISAYTGTSVIEVLSPIMVDGQIEGAFLVSYTIESIREILLTYTSDLGYALILDQDARIIMTTMSNYSDTDAFVKYAILEGKTIDEMLSDFKNGTSGSLTYTLFETKRLAQYAPLMINDWVLFFTVPEDTMIAREVHILNSMFIFTAIMAFFFIGFLLYILISRSRYLKKVEKVAYYDELTGLPNLHKLKNHMAKIIEDNDDKEGLIIVKMDIANFKAINELFDFDVGNQVLKTVAEASVNIAEPTFMIARTGADQFMMFAGNDFLKNLNNRRIAYEERFRSLIPMLDKYSITFRYGRYFIEPGENDVNDIVNKVNMAHSFAKTKGVEVIWDYDDNFKKQVLTLAEITNKMETALHNNEFKTYLQPKFSLSTNEIIGAEALVRWIEPEGNMIFPNIFIPLFESNGFIVELDKYMLDSICKKIREWLDKGYECVPVSVNFSRIHLQNPNFVEELRLIVTSNNIDPVYIEIELTETTITENEGDIEKLLDDLHDAGFTVSIDDFGAGYSSLGMLKNFKVDTLKLDRSFFVNNKYDDRGELVIDGIIKLAHTLNMHTVAEGVEEAEQVEFLKSVNCDSVQGYFFARPMDIDIFEKDYLIKD